MKGFTLVEMLLAVLILSIVITGLLLLYANCIILNDVSRNLAVATAHAQYIMEEIKNTNFNNIISTYNGACWDSAGLSVKGLASLTGESICASVSGTDVLDVTATVNWKDRRLIDRTTALETLIVEP